MTIAPATRADQAADWFLRLREEASEEELREWTQWCAADPENLREYERIRATWRGLGQLQSPAERRGFLAQHRALAAVAACVVVGAASLLAWNAGLFVSDLQMLTTRQTSNQSATLPDGSTLTLAPRTQVAVDFSGAERSLDLSQGEAYFTVQPDRNKPFVVRTAGLQVIAVGTAFNVKSAPGHVVVTVTEGLVEAANGEESWRVAAGHQIDYDLERRSARIAAVDAQRELGWREGRLEYFDKPLATVIADANRYSERRIEIADPRLESLTYTGTIFTQALEDWLQAMESTFDIRVEANDRRVLLHAHADALHD
jgi:transmembrane sensor